MPVENGMRYAEISKSLKEQPGVRVVGEVSTERVNERKGNAYVDTRFIVAPETGSVSDEQLSTFGAELLPGIEPVHRAEETIGFGRHTSFDRLGPNSFRTIAVEFYRDADEALKKIS